MTKIINMKDKYYKKNAQNYHLEVILFRLLGKAKRINSKLMKLIREKDIPDGIWRNSPVRFQCCPPVKCSNVCSVFTWQNSSSLIVQGFGGAGPTGTECQQSQSQSLKIPWRKAGAHHEPHGLFL